MIKLKNYISGISLMFASMAFAQGNSIPGHYSQMYENQVANNPTTKEAEKVLIGAKEQIDININRLMSDPVLRNANWGFVVYDPKTQKVVSSYNENNSFVPASTTKLLTTETAMSILGPKFRWITQLEYSGAIDADGNLNGNLYLVGSGDPTLGTGKAGSYSYSEIVSDFLYALSNKGIKKVSGDIIIQTGFFKENKVAYLPDNIVWLERGNYYLPVGSTRNIDPRSEKIIVKQANPFTEEKKYFYISPYNKQIVYAEKFEGNSIFTNLPAAPSSLANSLKSSLVKNGIPVLGTVVTRMEDRVPENRNIITSYKSPMLKDIIYNTNQRSDNALAEAILRMVGFQKAGDQSLESGRMVVVEHLRSENFDTNGLNYMDGSGLSKSNLVTPIAQAKFLSSLMNETYYKDFFDSLPIGGQTGTLKKMFYGNGYGQVFAKTGTLNKVKCLAGYVKTRTGKTLTFSLLVNNYSGSVDQVKSRMEELLGPVVEL